MPKWLKGAGRRPLFKLIGHCSLTWCGSRWSRLFKWFCRGQVSPAIHEDKAANKMQKCNSKTELVDCLTLQHLIIIRPIIDLFIWPIKFKFSWLDKFFFSNCNLLIFSGCRWHLADTEQWIDFWVKDLVRLVDCQGIRTSRFRISNLCVDLTVICCVTR